MSDSLKDLLLCMLQKDPVERITLPLMKVKFNPFSSGTDITRQNLTSIDVRF